MSASASTPARLRLALGVVLGTAVFAAAEPSLPSPRPSPSPVPEIEAWRSPGSIQIDGRLDEEAWQKVDVYADFRQRDPDEGQPATEDTELRLVYDDDALYVGARLYDREPQLVARRLSRRDEPADADHFTLFLDPRHDRRTGVRFEVSAAGVQRDHVIYNDTWTDHSWDAVWDSAVTHDARGWTVEMRIPFSELRFLPGQRQTWGINAARYIQRKNESDWLALVPKRENGLASRMATLNGIEDVRPKSPIVLVPFAAGGLERSHPDPADPLHDGSAVFGSVGLDVRRKLGGSFSLDGTVNPDFGQVEVDPAVVNLSDFETFFPEKRPFFVEGAQIFDNFGRNGLNNYQWYLRSEPDLFYTRRIGRPPQGELPGGFVEQPRATTILAAAKLTGKTASGWSLGVLEAVTGREEASWAEGERSGVRQTEPLTNYLVVRAFRDADRAGYGVLATLVNRDLADPGLARQLVSDALVAGVDGYLFLDEDKDWAMSARLAASEVRGDREAIERLQLGSTRYYQRPDRPDEPRFDPQATSMGGWTGSVDVNRQSGGIRLNAAAWATSPGFEANDLGFNPRSDRWGGHLAVQFLKPEPDQLTRFRSLTLAKSYAYNFDGDKQGDAVNLGVRAAFRNYWDLGLNGSFRWRALDDRATRGGPSMVSGEAWSLGTWLGSDGRKPVVGRFGAWYFRNEYGSRQWDGEATVELRPSTALSLAVGPSWTRAHRVAQWVAQVLDAELPAEVGGHHVFASFAQSEVALTVRLAWIFSPRLSLQLYAQPLLSRGDYQSFKELARARSFDFATFGPEQVSFDPHSATYTVAPGSGAPFAFAEPDFNYRSLRLNTVLRWEWRPGSALYAVWTQGRESSSNLSETHLGRNLDELLASPATNTVEVKATFRLGG